MPDVVTHRNEDAARLVCDQWVAGLGELWEYWFTRSLAPIYIDFVAEFTSSLSDVIKRLVQQKIAQRVAGRKQWGFWLPSRGQGRKSTEGSLMTLFDLEDDASGWRVMLMKGQTDLECLDDALAVYFIHEDPMSDRMVLTSGWPMISQIACTMKLASFQNHLCPFIQSGQCDGWSSLWWDRKLVCLVPDETSDVGHYTRLVQHNTSLAEDHVKNQQDVSMGALLKPVWS